jgi:DNA-binding HxlR family transcriptional regulator
MSPSPPSFPSIAALDHQSIPCLTVRDVLSRVGDKWSVLVIGVLGQGPRRFSELRRGITGISQRMLTLTLRSLEREGLVARVVYPTAASHVEYSLTDMGRTLLEPVLALSSWAAAHGDEIREARARFDAARDDREP